MRARRAIEPALLESARGGDQHALLAVLAAAQPDIQRYARRSCRIAADAEEAAQEAMLILYRRMGSLRVIEAFSGWLFAIVKRECLRLARITLRWTPLDPLEDSERLARRPPEELRIDIALAIQSLPEAYRETVLMRDCEDLTIDEIAARLGATREAVKARLHRARKLLREYLSA